MKQGLQFQEIERKFLPPKRPLDLDQLPFTLYERYYLYADEHVELRIQKREQLCELEHKVQSGDIPLARDSLKIEIPTQEWEALKAKCVGNGVIFKKYRLPSQGLSVKEYEGALEGLLIAEQEFSSSEEASSYQPEEWMGEDISTLEFSRDHGLIQYASLDELWGHFPSLNRF